MTTAQELIDKFRGSAEDFGNTVTDQFTGDAVTTRWQASNVPIQTGSDTVTIGGVPSTNYTLNVDNGEFLFNSAPGAVTVQMQYTKVQYRDSRILDALAQGVRRLYPWVYKSGECYVAVTSQQFNYDLTSATDVPIQSAWDPGIVPSSYLAATARTDLAKPQTRIHRAEYLGGGLAGAVSWSPFTNFNRSTASQLETDSAFSPGGALKLIYSAPCIPPTAVGDTMDVPDAYIDLPVWYALGTVMVRKEMVRDRSDALFPQGYGVMSTPPGTQRMTGEDYMQLFWTTLRTSPMPPLRTEIRRRVPAYAR